MSQARSGWAGVRLAARLAGLLLCSAAFAADSRSVDYDNSVDFAALKTFAIREGKVHSQKPELNNRLFVQAIQDTIRTALTARGLTEVADRPDVFLDFSLAGTDYSVIGGQRSTRTPDGPGGQRGTVIPGTGPQPMLFTEGTLVIDMTKRESGALIWRGTYRDEERSGPALARKLPEDAKQLLADYPPKKRK
jgi:hypothetical protein